MGLLLNGAGIETENHPFVFIRNIYGMGLLLNGAGIETLILILILCW